MPRLLINQGSTGPREIQLKPGANSLGRGVANDFKIEDPSVSTSHCQILVEQQNVIIKDLGSTNGTYINRSPVQEAALQAGQTIHLGGVEMVFYADAAAYSVARLVREPATEVELPPPPTTDAPPIAARIVTPTRVVTHTSPGSQNCKFHPKTAGRFFCAPCQKYFCELCVTSRMMGAAQHKFCRHCGTECEAVQVQIARPVARKGFFKRLPGAFIYPFKGSGLLMLIVATVAFALLSAVSGIFSIMATMAALGYLFAFMQNIIHCTAAEDDEMPNMPDFDGLFGSFFTLAGVVAFCFGVPIALAVAKFFFEVEIPVEALIGTMVLSCLYFPMAFLAVAMKDTAIAANPLIVIPAIIKVPLEYFVAAVLLTGVFGVRLLGNAVMALAAVEGQHTRDMSVLFISLGMRAFWSFASIYLLTVGMRILGLLYVTKKEKFGWFSR